MEIENIYLNPVKEEFVKKLFAGKTKKHRFALIADICDAARISYEKADKKLAEIERQGYIVPLVDRNYEDYYEIGGR